MPEDERGKRLATGYSALKREGSATPLPFFQPCDRAGGGLRLDGARPRALRVVAVPAAREGRHGGAAAATLREMQRVHWMEPDWKTSWGLGFAV